VSINAPVLNGVRPALDFTVLKTHFHGIGMAGEMVIVPTSRNLARADPTVNTRLPTFEGHGAVRVAVRNLPVAHRDGKGVAMATLIVGTRHGLT
jgi:hypothetical protein